MYSRIIECEIEFKGGRIVKISLDMDFADDVPLHSTIDAGKDALDIYFRDFWKAKADNFSKMIFRSLPKEKEDF